MNYNPEILDIKLIEDTKKEIKQVSWNFSS